LCLAAVLVGDDRPLQLSTLWQHIVVGVFAVGALPVAVRSRLEQVAPQGRRMMEFDAGGTIAHDDKGS